MAVEGITEDLNSPGGFVFFRMLSPWYLDLDWPKGIASLNMPSAMRAFVDKPLKPLMEEGSSWVFPGPP